MPGGTGPNSVDSGMDTDTPIFGLNDSEEEIPEDLSDTTSQRCKNIFMG